jgi:hypothetical protein
MVVNIVSFEFGYMMMEVALKVDSLVTPLDKAMVPAEYTTLEKGTHFSHNHPFGFHTCTNSTRARTHARTHTHTHTHTHR